MTPKNTIKTKYERMVQHTFYSRMRESSLKRVLQKHVLGEEDIFWRKWRIPFRNGGELLVCLEHSRAFCRNFWVRRKGSIHPRTHSKCAKKVNPKMCYYTVETKRIASDSFGILLK